jgi:hypothetical protein
MMVCWSSLPLFSMLLFGARGKFLLIETADKPGLSADQPEQEQATPAKKAALALPAATLPPKSPEAVPPPPLPELDLKDTAPSALDNPAAPTKSAAAVPAEPAMDILSQLEAEFAGAHLLTAPVAALPAVNAAAQPAAPVAAPPAVNAAAQPVAHAKPAVPAKQAGDVDSFLIETVDSPTQGLGDAA